MMSSPEKKQSARRPQSRIGLGLSVSLLALTGCPPTEGGNTTPTTTTAPGLPSACQPGRVVILGDSTNALTTPTFDKLEEARSKNGMPTSVNVAKSGSTLRDLPGQIQEADTILKNLCGQDNYSKNSIAHSGNNDVGYSVTDPSNYNKAKTTERLDNFKNIAQSLGYHTVYMAMLQSNNFSNFTQALELAGALNSYNPASSSFRSVENPIIDNRTGLSDGKYFFDWDHKHANQGAEFIDKNGVKTTVAKASAENEWKGFQELAGV